LPGCELRKPPPLPLKAVPKSKSNLQTNEKGG
jgi:hypothetical protein